MADQEPVEGYDPEQLDKKAAAVEEAVAVGLELAAASVASDIGQQFVAGPADAVTVPGVWAQIVEDRIAPLISDIIYDTAETIRLGIADAGERLYAGEAIVPTEVLDPRPIDNVTAEGLLSHATNRMNDIGNDLWLNIQQTLAEGVAQGESIPELAERVREAAPMTEPRARTVARTESQGASNGASIAQARSAGVSLNKTWLATLGDGRTRPAHLAAEGQTVPLDEPFMIGEPVAYPLDFPGDPTGPPELTINCRCTLSYSLLRIPAGPITVSSVHLFTCREGNSKTGKVLHKGPCAGWRSLLPEDDPRHPNNSRKAKAPRERKTATAKGKGEQAIREELQTEYNQKLTAAKRETAAGAARQLAEMAIEVEELLAKGASEKGILHTLRARMKRLQLEPDLKAGEKVKFDPKRHDIVGGAAGEEGKEAVVIRPGYTWKGPDGDVLIERPLVQTAIFRLIEQAMRPLVALSQPHLFTCTGKDGKPIHPGPCVGWKRALPETDPRHPKNSPPKRARKKAPRKNGPDDKVRAARERQARIDKAREAGNGLAAKLEASWDDGDVEATAQLRSQLDKQAEEAGVRLFGEPDALVPFDPRIHDAGEQRVRAGQLVEAIAPGVAWMEEPNVTLKPAAVYVPTAGEIERAAAQNQAPVMGPEPTADRSPSEIFRDIGLGDAVTGDFADALDGMSAEEMDQLGRELGFDIANEDLAGKADFLSMMAESRAQHARTLETPDGSRLGQGAISEVPQRLTPDQAQALQDVSAPPLAPEQYEAIRDYSKTGYTPMNALLRGGPASKLPAPEDDARYRDEIEAIRSAMRPWAQATTVDRLVRPDAFGIDIDDPQTAEKLAELNGSTFQDQGFFSTTVAELPKIGDPRSALLHIEVPKGTPAAYIQRVSEGGYKGGEEELLLDAGLTYQITDVTTRLDDAGDPIHEVFMRVVPLEPATAGVTVAACSGIPAAHLFTCLRSHAGPCVSTAARKPRVVNNPEFEKKIHRDQFGRFGDKPDVPTPRKRAPRKAAPKPSAAEMAQQLRTGHDMEDRRKQLAKLTVAELGAVAEHLGRKLAGKTKAQKIESLLGDAGLHAVDDRQARIDVVREPPGKAHALGSAELDYETISALPTSGPVGNEQLAAISRSTGVAGNPRVVTESEYEKAKSEGARPLFRGVADRGKVQEFHDGPLRFGTGIYGNGYYFTNDQGFAGSYGVEGDPESVEEYLLPKNAKIVTYLQILKEIARDHEGQPGPVGDAARRLTQDLGRAKDSPARRSALARFKRVAESVGDKRAIVLSDAGNYAAAKGYDAIRVPSAGKGIDEYVVLNPRAILRAASATVAALSSGNLGHAKNALTDEQLVAEFAKWLEPSPETAALHLFTCMTPQSCGGACSTAVRKPRVIKDPHFEGLHPRGFGGEFGHKEDLGEAIDRGKVAGPRKRAAKKAAPAKKAVPAKKAAALAELGALPE